MGSFKNIENPGSENATYSAYKKLTAQDVVITQYTAKKLYSISGSELSSNRVFSFLFDKTVQEG